MPTHKHQEAGVKAICALTHGHAQDLAGNPVKFDVDRTDERVILKVRHFFSFV